ncbi:MAG: acyltransferase [Flavobacteriales bacterium]|nr:acyltransferase [Flavobacteriales bacterium]
MLRIIVRPFFLLFIRSWSRFRKEVIKIGAKGYMFAMKMGFNVTIGKRSVFKGIPKVIVNGSGCIMIGNDFAMNSGRHFNPIGRNQQSLMYVGKGATLSIGNNVGMSSAAIVCSYRITLGNNIKLGGNTVIYDSDFHSLNAIERTAIPEVKENIGMAEVIIGDNVFIGAHSTILKGVAIGKNSIVGAGSVVAKSIPEREIWGGNPAKFIRKVE